MPTRQTLFLIDGESATPIPRLPKSHKEFKEAWVRDLVFRHPELLPIEEARADGGVFVPIATEVSLSRAGIADVLGVTTGGYPVVVETKLWKNPQARREVLAQTIDYIKELARNDYSAFEALWRRRRGSGSGQTLFDAASAASLDELDEIEFIDRIGRACERGDILGFIVGDGIQHGLTELVDQLGLGSSHLRYSISLLELRCYQLPDGGLAVLPAIVRDIVPVERAYIQIDQAQGLGGTLRITSTSKPSAVKPEPGKRRTLTEDEFWREFNAATGDAITASTRAFVDALSTHVETDFKQRALMLKVPDPDDANAGVSVFAITCDGKAYNTDHGPRQARRWGMSESRVDEIFREFYERLQRICPGFSSAGIGHMSVSQFIPVTEFADRLDDVAEEIKRVAARLTAARRAD
ncbi:MAG: hypothetical protein ACF8R9_09255 [Phycisphaerales bacterium JB054]